MSEFLTKLPAVSNMKTTSPNHSAFFAPNKGKRAIHLLVDVTLISIPVSTCTALFSLSTAGKNLTFTVVFILYYFMFEAMYGRTPGKMLTKTEVVNTDNSRPGTLRIFVRTLLRLNPFDGVSYLFGGEHGTHDQLSGTRVRETRFNHNEH